jgi:hypothetical protein
MTGIPHTYAETVPYPGPVLFPRWARFALGALVAITGYVIAGDIIQIGDAERAVLSSLILVFASAGIVPPSPKDLMLSPGVRLGLGIVVVALGYLLNTVIEPDLNWLRIVAVLAFAASLGLTPPQTRMVLP